MNGSRTWIVEVDGTLVDSRGLHVESLRGALGGFGFDDGNDGPWEEALRWIRDRVPGRQIGEILARKQRIYVEACARGLRTRPGTEKLLAWLRGHGVQLFATSIGTEEETAATLAAAGISRWFESVVEAVEHPFDSRALLLGSTPHDVAAASAAGLAMLALRCGGCPDEDLDGATGIYDDPAHLLALLAHRPFAEPAGLRTAGFATLP